MVRIARASAIAATAFLAAVSVSAQYGSAADVEEFSDALLHAGYADLARDEVKSALDRGIQDGSGLLAYALCEITATEALRTPDPSTRLAKLKEAVAAYEDYVKKFAATEKAAEARLKLSEWLRTAGELVGTLIKKETDAAKKDVLKTDGINLFTKAEVLAKARIETLAAIQKDKQTEDQQNELVALRFTVARMPYSKALLYENRTGVEAQSLLNESQSLLEEFDLDAPPGHILVFEARRIVALIAIERDDEKTAEETLTASCDQLAEAVAVALKDQSLDLVKDLPENAEVRELIARMFLEKAEFLVRTKKQKDWKGALDTTEQLNKLVPDLVRLKDGKAALMILAEALAEEGQTPKARTVAQLIVDRDPSGDAGLRAREMLDKLGTGGGGGGGTDADALLKVLAGTVERKDVTQGERIAARILTSPEANKKPEIIPETLLQLGGLYFQAGRFVDAAVTFRAVAEEYSASPRAPEAKFNEAIAFAKQAAADGKAASKFWKDKSRTARDDLTKRFASSKEAADVSWFVAEDKREDKPAEAAELYLKVPTSSPKYAEAQYEGGMLAYEIALSARMRDKLDETTKWFLESEKAMKNSIAAYEASAKNTINAGEIANAKNRSFSARLRLAGLYIQKEIKKPDAALAVLDEVEAAAKEDKDKLGKVWSLRIKALNAAGRGKEAVDLIDKQLDIATPDTLVQVAAAIDTDAMERLKANEKDTTVDDDLKIAGKYYALAVKKAAGMPGRIDFGRVGERLLYIGARLSKLDDNLGLAAIDTSVPIAHKDLIDAAKKALQMSTSEGEINVDRQRAIAFAAATGGDWIEAITALREVTNKHALFNPQGRFIKEALTAVPRLADVYQDLAVAHLRGAKGERALFDVAKSILANLINNSDQTSKRYWEARYLHLLTLKEAQDYKELETTLAALERSAPDADGNKFGIKAKIDEIRVFSKKIVNK